MVVVNSSTENTPIFLDMTPCKELAVSIFKVVPHETLVVVMVVTPAAAAVLVVVVTVAAAAVREHSIYWQFKLKGKIHHANSKTYSSICFLQCV
jgi:hypothetical protein